MMFILDDIWTSVCSDLGDRWFFWSRFVQVEFEGWLQQMTLLSIVPFYYLHVCMYQYSTYVVQLQRWLCEKFQCSRSIYSGLELIPFVLHASWSLEQIPWILESIPNMQIQSPQALELIFSSLDFVGTFWQVGEWNRSLLCEFDAYSCFYAW